MVSTVNIKLILIRFAGIFLVSFYQCALAQSLSGIEKYTYSYPEYLLELYPETKNYYIFEYSLSEDYEIKLPLSYGCHKYNGHKVILFDSLTNQKLVYKLIDKLWLYPVKTYCFISDIIWRQEIDTVGDYFNSVGSLLTFY